MENLIITSINYKGILPVKYNYPFKFSYQGIRVGIIMHKLQKGVRIDDTNNELVDGDRLEDLHSKIGPFQNGHLIKITTNSLTEANVKDRFESLHLLEDIQQNREVYIQEVYYTEILIFTSHSDFRHDIFNDDRKKSRYDKKIFTCLNYFIAKYNSVLKQGNLEHFREEQSNISFKLKQAFYPLSASKNFDYYLSLKEELKLKVTSTQLSKAGEYGIFFNDFAFVDSKTQELAKKLREDSLSPEEEFLSLALEQFRIYGKFKHAYLEAFLAVEQSVEKFLRRKKLASGISENVLDENNKQVGITYKIQIEIPLAMGQPDEVLRGLIKDVIIITKKRNKVVHSGQEVSSKECFQAIETIYQFVSFLENVN